MSGFQFPTPPPPPPPPPSDGLHSQVGSRTQSSFRGRGRGRECVERRDRSTGSKNAGHTSSYPNPATATGCYDVGHIAPAGVPPGSYVNPAFARATALPSNGVNYADSPQRQVGYKTHALAALSPASATPTLGLKRKLDSFQRAQCQSDLQNRRTSTSNSSGLPSQTGPHRAYVGRPQQSKEFKVNVLGLTPGNSEPHYTSSESEGEDESIDEEALLVHGLGSNLTFHDTNGELRTLSTAADLVAWRNARRANFPTKNRLSQKHARKRQIGAERKRFLTEAKEALHNAMCSEWPTSNTLPIQRRVKTKYSRLDAGASHVASSAVPTFSAGRSLSQTYAKESDCLENRSDQSRLSMSVTINDLEEAHAEHAHERTQDIHEPWIDDDGKPEASNPKRDAVLSSTRPALSKDVLDWDSSDEPPEETTSKQRPTPKTKSIACKQFVVGGYCRDGSTCRFMHELPDRARLEHERIVDLQKNDPFAPVLDESDHDSRKTLHQRLLARDRDDEEQLALQVIKYLGSKSFFSAH